MKKSSILSNTKVIDRWWKDWGTGIITNVKKTVFTVKFPKQSIVYDYAHAQFLEEVK